MGNIEELTKVFEQEEKEFQAFTFTAHQAF